MVNQKTVDKAIRCMATLNKRASELMQKTVANACTDITGFDLLGHACEMAENESELLDTMHHEGISDAVTIGEVLDEPRGKITVR
jgi:selenophosphate synthase